jgi:glycosyltransferase involved in cell wall biosynthesis
MKIGIILSQTPAYSETFFISKIKGLQRNGIAVSLYCQIKKDDFKACPVIESAKVTSNPFLQIWYFVKEAILLFPNFQVIIRYIKLERKEKSGFFQIFKKIYLNAHLLKAKVDWLHFGFATQALGSETVAKAINAKMAVSFRGFDINVYPIKHTNSYQKLWKYVDKVHSISEYLLYKAREMGLSENTPYAIITPAVQLDMLPVSKSINTSSENIKIVTIARLTWIKGLDIAIAAMDKLKKKNIKFTYFIIGEGDQNYKERYKFMAYELGLKEEIIFCGKLSHQETLAHLSAATLYVQPSLNEGFCNAVLEAQALGKLTIASNVGGLSENIVEGKTGWLFETGSSKSLVSTIEKIIDLPVKKKIEVAENAKMRVKKSFNIEMQKEEFIAFYS